MTHPGPNPYPYSTPPRLQASTPTPSGALLPPHGMVANASNFHHPHSNTGSPSHTMMTPTMPSNYKVTRLIHTNPLLTHPFNFILGLSLMVWFINVHFLLYICFSILCLIQVQHRLPYRHLLEHQLLHGKDQHSTV